MLKYLTRKSVETLAAISAAMVVTFLLVRLAPGNYADYVLGSADVRSGRDPAVLERISERYGLGDSIPEQLFRWLGQVIQGDFGQSFKSGRDVSDLLWDGVRNTVPMVLLGLVAGIALGITLGVVAAARRGSVIDTLISSGAMTLQSLPAQWLGIMLLLLFAGKLPSGGRRDPFAEPGGWFAQRLDTLEHMVLPSSTLALITMGGYVLITRAAVLDAMAEEHVLMARAKGFGRRRILMREVLRNALLPISNLVALSLGAVVGGALLIEVVFSWNGFGSLVAEAIRTRDFPVIQGAFLVLTISIVFFNLVADVLARVLDPRVELT